ncbi:MAG: DUF3488 domain-containing protein [Blastocatellia bacterium]|nr:DUF3488 domain-containing protein [Blastocatellia bacterium]
MIKSNTLEKYFKICSYLLITQGFLTLCLTGNVDFISMVLYSIALILSWYSDKADSKLQIKPQTANWLAISFLPFVYIDFRYISSSYVGPLIHYSLFISIFNLFKVKADRDWVFLYLIAVFEILLAATLTIDITFIIMLSIFLLLILATLEAFEVKRSQGEVYKPKEEKLLNQIGRALPLRRITYLVGVTFAIVLLIGMITAPVFLMIPRLNTNFMARSFGATTVSITGFSDVVELGQVGDIKKSEQVVMNVRLKTDATKLAKLPKWRGVTLSQYNGRSWSEPRREQRKALRPIDGLYKVDEPSKNPFLLEQTFYLEPLSTPVVFVAPRPLTVNNQLPSLYSTTSDTLTTADHSYKQIVYTAYSDISLPPLTELKKDEQPYSQETKDHYLQVPDMDERVAKLAQDVTQGATTRFDKARAIEQYLKKNYSYSLEMKRTGEVDPLVDFLFNTQQGHCEYFASAMVIMLRHIGVAARIVNGFQTGEYNEVNNTFTIRQSEAHSWVEVYFPTTDTWMDFDPTPSAGFSQYTNNIANKLKKYFSAVRMLWLDYVVTYDSERQSYLSTRVRDTVSSYKSSLESYIFNFRRYLLNSYNNFSTGQIPVKNLAIISILGSLTILTFLTWQFRQLLKGWQLAPGKLFSSWWARQLFLPWLRWRTKNNPQQSAVLFYNEMLVVLEKKGFKKQKHQTPLEFATNTKLSEVAELTNYYNNVRFSNIKLNQQEEKQVRELIKKLAKKKTVNKIPVSNLKRLGLATSAVSLLFLLGATVFYFYNERHMSVSSRLAKNQILSFTNENYRSPRLVEKIIGQVRQQPGNGALDLAEALAPGQPAEVAPKGKLPWDDYFDPASQPTKDELAKIFERPEIALIEKAATYKTFDISELTNLTPQHKIFVNNLDHLTVIDRVDVLLWKAYVQFREGKTKECERTFALVISLGDNLRQDYSVNNVSLGYRVLARGSLAIAKYNLLSDNEDQAKEWFSIMRRSYQRRTRLQYLVGQIHLAGGSDRNLTELFALAVQKDEPALAQQATVAIGQAWLNNPNQVILGLSKQRKLFLMALTEIKKKEIVKTANSCLETSTKMSFFDRWKEFRERYKKRF